MVLSAIGVVVAYMGFTGSAKYHIAIGAAGAAVILIGSIMISHFSVPVYAETETGVQQITNENTEDHSEDTVVSEDTDALFEARQAVTETDMAAEVTIASINRTFFLIIALFLLGALWPYDKEAT